MKNFIQYLTVFAVLQISTLQVFSQTNYHGVSGNMVVGDFDNDKVADDIAAFNTAGNLPVLTLWTSDNGWTNESEANCRLPFDYINTKAINSKLVAGDFDNDGFVDDIASIYEIGYNKTSITVWLNNDGEFTPKRWWHGNDFDANQVAQTIVVGDFDKDGFEDDIAAFYDYGQEKTKVFVWKSNGKEFSWPGTWWVGNDFNSTNIKGSIVVGDFNHDGYKNDIAALYNYIDDYCKIFVWTTKNNEFNWPYTWFSQANFAVNNIKNSVIAGDFNNNGFVDNIAAFHKTDNNSSSILVFEKDKQGFKTPDTWWYGNNEAASTDMRLVATGFDINAKPNQITGLSIIDSEATLMTWTAQNKTFTIPETVWQGVALAIDDCEKDGNCLPNSLNEEFSLYPNPNNGQFSVEIPNSNNLLVDVTIYNVLGSQVIKLQAQSGTTLPIQMDELKTGSYIIQITGKDFTLNKNFIVE